MFYQGNKSYSLSLDNIKLSMFLFKNYFFDYRDKNDLNIPCYIVDVVDFVTNKFTGLLNFINLMNQSSNIILEI